MASFEDSDIGRYEEAQADRASLKQQPQYVAVPEVVKQFVTYFHRHIQDRNVYDIFSMYENSWTKITEKYFKQTEWPHPLDISYLVNDDPLFMVLYKEMYFRHIYANLSPSLEHRIASWNNYCDFFNFLLNAPSPESINIALPNQWIWDMVDEFIYQFQSFCQYRSKLSNKSQEELVVLRNNPQVWNTVNVLNILNSLVAKSNISRVLEREKSGVTDHDRGFATHPIYRMIGYFSLIGLCRIHCILGNYPTALRALGPIELGGKGPYTQVTACYVTLYYYVGFSYLMMRRYADAIRTFQSVILYITRTKAFSQRSYAFDQIQKKNEQLYGLLSICLSLCPQRVDENIHAVLREKYSDKMLRMQRGDDQSLPSFEELFTFCCPKFISAASPNFALVLEDPVAHPPLNYNQEALRVQTKLFLQEVQQQAQIPTIRSYLKLYTTIGTEKLAEFLDEKDEKAFRALLLCFKHKARSLQWSSGPLLTGELTYQSDVDFSIDNDMIVIHDSKPARQYVDFFVRHITKFEEIGNLAKQS
eukprot:TRINITY_DN16187_c0_g1_i1.p1 TRINITY_DN16187_c0_g1~~TRINITY_DN16187_c0_g1_i1.p1  ORF type:complete len:532 (-),score=91.29 TRINITY_DN16187_c0_g1_i1:120-1715(-)